MELIYVSAWLDGLGTLLTALAGGFATAVAWVLSE
jgi:hypothetical protein